jgi:hypothetical protein
VAACILIWNFTEGDLSHLRGWQFAGLWRSDTLNDIEEKRLRAAVLSR